MTQHYKRTQGLSSYLQILTFILCSFSIDGFSQDNSKNYVSTWVPRVAVKDVDLKSLEGTSDVNITIGYIDGLGRSSQMVSRGGSPLGKDVVEYFQYDALGRLPKKYLPYVAADNSGVYRNNANGEQGLFYNQPVASTVSATHAPFSETIFDDSPLSVVLEQGNAGEVWQPISSNYANSGHTTKFTYATNNSIDDSNISGRRALKYIVNIDVNGNRTLSYQGVYADGTLVVKIVKTTNWQDGMGKLFTMEDYTDALGRLVLKRLFVKDGSNPVQAVSTYYVYDEFGFLCYVLPPGSNPDGGAIDENILNKYCFQYQYNVQHLQSAKKIPGKAWIYQVYNKIGQLVASQDGGQRSRNEWTINKYDGLGRNIISGTWNNSNTAVTPGELKTMIDSNNSLFERRIPTGNGYSNQAWPESLLNYYNINYYDNYDIPGIPSSLSFESNTSFSLNVPVSNSNGLLTASKTWVLNTSTEIWKVSYYNVKGLIIQSQLGNHLGGRDIIDTEYDFLGQVIKNQRKHFLYESSQPLIVENRFEYNHTGKLLKSYSKVGADAEILLSQFDYNELGQLIDKKLHRKQGESKFLQSIDFRYNSRGWLTSLNAADLSNNAINTDDISSDTDKFGMELNYDNAMVAQYNGNIGSIEMSTVSISGFSSPHRLKYDFHYDALDRLTDGISSTGGVKDGNINEHVRYDLEGNIQKIGRWTKLSAGRTQIDSLVYSYDGNRQHRVDDLTGNAVYGFSDGVQQDNEYEYDVNGNLKKDLNKGIVSIVYNSFNLPETVTWNNGTNISYFYDGLGSKLQKKYNNGSSIITTDYINSFQYENEQMLFIPTTEGRVLNNGGVFIYQYDLKDHLGNTRVVIQPGAGSADIAQISNYYPFGAEISGDDLNYLMSYVSGRKNNYLYNGKELQSEGNLKIYDYGARTYDPFIGRWNGIDPLADNYLGLSPYSFAGNNPVNFIDRDGKSFTGVMAVFGAIFGAAFEGINTSRKFNTSEFWSDVGKGAVVGGVSGAAAGMVIDYTIATFGTGPVATVGAMVAAGVVENAASQMLTEGSVDLGQAAMAGAVGGAMGHAAYKIGPTVGNILSKTESKVVVESFSVTDNLGSIGGKLASEVRRNIERSLTDIGEKTIGLGLDVDLPLHRGTGAITYKGAGWQEAGLTKMDWGRASMDDFSFKQSFKEAAEKADAIRFEVSNFNPFHSKPGVTNFEFNHILNDPSLFQKTTFISDGSPVLWNGTGFLK